MESSTQQCKTHVQHSLKMLQSLLISANFSDRCIVHVGTGIFYLSLCNISDFNTPLNPLLFSRLDHLLGGGAGTVFLKLLKCSRYCRMVSEGEYSVSGLCLRTGGGVSAEFPTMLWRSSFIMFQQSFRMTQGQYSTCQSRNIKVDMNNIHFIHILF